jgi:plastocyanin
MARAPESTPHPLPGPAPGLAGGSGRFAPAGRLLVCMRRLLPILATLALAAVTVVPAAARGGGSAARAHTVTLHEFRFHPGTLNINRGDSVTWVWRDEVEHNVTFHGFHSRTQEHGTYTVRFRHAGTFNYRCTIHFEEGMKGRIVVH